MQNSGTRDMFNELPSSIHFENDWIGREDRQ